MSGTFLLIVSVLAIVAIPAFAWLLWYLPRWVMRLPFWERQGVETLSQAPPALSEHEIQGLLFRAAVLVFVIVALVVAGAYLSSTTTELQASLNNIQRGLQMVANMQYADRFNRAVALIDHEQLTQRLSGITDLEQLARDAPGQYRERVFTLLTAHVKNVTQGLVIDASIPADSLIPAPDTQAILNALRRRQVPRRRQEGVDLRGAVLAGGVLDNANLAVSYFEDANLRGAQFDRANLRGTSLDRADLRTASFRSANLTGASLNKADLSGADFDYARLNNASFVDALLTGATFHGANLTNAAITQEQLNQACADTATVIPAGLQRPPPCPGHGPSRL
jgi:hypothetical protein